MFTGRLYPYQEEAVDRTVERGSMLLACGMGTGKTPMAIAACEEWLATDEADCCLLVVPAALKWQWAQRLAQFTDMDSGKKKVGSAHITIPSPEQCMVIDGTPARKAEQYARVLEERPDYVLLSYDSVIADWKWVRKIQPDIAVLDECTAIKSFAAKRTKRIKRIDAHFRLGLTGTVMDNGQPEEAFSIMQWVDEDVFGRWDYFDSAFIVRSKAGFPVAYKNLPLLHEKLADAMVRYTTDDPEVAAFMPEVHHREEWMNLDRRTLRVYARIAEDLMTELRLIGGTSLDLTALYTGAAGGNESTGQGRAMARAMALQMLINHPDLIRDSAANYDGPGNSGSKYCSELVDSGALDNLNATPKLDALVRLVRKELMRDPEAKIIVFSFFKGLLPRIAEALSQYRSVFYHGDMTPLKKAEAKEVFSSDPEVRLFLASDAGGYGLDIPEARILVNVDQRDSAGAMDQRNTRHVRASSVFKEVEVVDLLAHGTIEERKIERLDRKRRTASAILDNHGADKGGRVSTKVESLTANLERTLDQLPWAS